MKTLRPSTTPTIFDILLGGQFEHRQSNTCRLLFDYLGQFGHHCCRGTGRHKVVSGPELAGMSVGEFAQTTAEATIFGRITPQQKEALVEALQSQGEYVAMMGDGVNDVLSLKKANMGIAMESGSSATRSVVAMILLGDSFEAMPQALTEGQRIVNSI